MLFRFTFYRTFHSQLSYGVWLFYNFSKRHCFNQLHKFFCLFGFCIYSNVGQCLFLYSKSKSIKHTGKNDEAETEKFHSILNENNARILDDSMLPDAAMVEVNVENANQLRIHLGNKWQFFPEKKYSVPDTRKKLKK